MAVNESAVERRPTIGRRDVADLGAVGEVASGARRRRRLVRGVDRDAAAVNVLGVLGQDEAAVQQRRETDRGELERPVVDDGPGGLGSPRRAGAARGGRLRSSSGRRRLAGRLGRRRGRRAGRGRRAAAPGRRAARGRPDRQPSAPRRPPAGSSRWRIARASCASLRLRTIRARSTRLIWPFSSDTTTTTASVCSVIPRAARWRVPKRSVWTVVSASGRSAPAARIASPRMITAPSWSAVRGMKIVRSRSAERSPWIITPVSAISSSPVSRSITMSAPWPSADSGGGRARDLVRDVLGGPRARPATAATRTSRPGRCARGPGAAPAGRRRRARTGRRPRRVCRIWVSRRRLQGLASDVDDEQDADADDEPDGAGPADQAEEPVDEERGDPDVEHRASGEPDRGSMRGAPASSAECTIGASSPSAAELRRRSAVSRASARANRSAALVHAGTGQVIGCERRSAGRAGRSLSAAAARQPRSR